MKLFFVLALFIASAFAENSATTSFTGPAELVKHIAEFDDKSARGLNAFKICKSLRFIIKFDAELKISLILDSVEFSLNLNQ